MFLGSRLVFADLPRHDPGLTRTGQSAFPDQIFLKICTGGFRTGAANTFVNTCRLLRNLSYAAVGLKVTSSPSSLAFF